MREWMKLLGKYGFVTWMNGGVASKLMVDAFDSRMREWMKLLGQDAFVTWMCEGVASKLMVDAFDKRMREWLILMGTDKFVGFLTGGIAARWIAIPNTMVEFVVKNGWSQTMTQRLCWIVPYQQKHPIIEEQWTDVYKSIGRKRKTT
jgi:hypothetical protein